MSSWIQVFAPIVVICTIFALLVLFGIWVTYLGLREWDRRKRACPNCGRKGSGDVIESDVISTRSYVDTRQVGKAKLGRSTTWGAIRVTETQYEDLYQCSICGHRWTRESAEVERVPVSDTQYREKP
jgi:hypothetical protein